MNAKDFADIIRLVRRTPLQNMEEAEYVNQLLQRFADHADTMLIELPDDNISELKPGGSA